MKRLLCFFLLFSFVAAQPRSPSPGEVEITSEPSHHLAIENEYVRVFKVAVAAHGATLPHRHRHDYIFVTLGDAHISNEVAGLLPVDAKLSDGDTRFTPGNFVHLVRVLSDGPFRNITIELVQDEKLRQQPSRWESAENGNVTFPGGRIRTLFVKDGVRVSEVNLEPDGVVPSHHHDAPHLVVALTDLDLRSDVPGKEPMRAQVKTGDVKWVPGGYTHTVTNKSNAPARFVTVEF